MKFYKCPICGNIITLIEGKEKLVRCCGQELEELVPNTKEGATEKHIPVYKKVEDKIEVTVGEVEHPMLEEHYIVFIAEVVEDEVHIVKLHPNEKPKATFEYKPHATLYAYCNTHELWSSEVE